MDPIHSLINDLYHQTGSMEESTFDEQLLATFFDTTPPMGNFECNVIEQYISTPLISDTSESYDDNDNDNKNDSDNTVSTDVQKSQPSKNKRHTKKQVVIGGAKRKRQPGQVQDHIMAERKRRELLSQMFITLSTMVPGLKKIDKTSVLGEAIKHMKELQEKVKKLESVVAKNVSKSMIAVKKLKLTIDKDDNDDNVCLWTVEDYCGNCDSSDGNDDGGNNGGKPFSEIEVKVLGTKLLLRVYCEKRKGILAKLFAEIHKHHMTISNYSV